MGIDEHSCFRKIALWTFRNTNDHEVPRIFINKNIFMVFFDLHYCCLAAKIGGVSGMPNKKMSFLLGAPLDLHYLCRLDKQTIL